MISEKVFVREFHGFWAEFLPLLTPSFVAVFNEAYKSYLTDASGKPYAPVGVRGDPRRSDVVSEAAFNIAKLSVRNQIAIEVGANDKGVVQEAASTAQKLISRYTGDDEFTVNALTNDEIAEACELAMNYSRLFAGLAGDGQAEFSPVIRGAGYVSECVADLSIGTTLFEVKTVARNVQSKDLRQLILYFALHSASGVTRWTRSGLFNPRRVTLHLFDIEYVIYHASGGRAAIEVYRDLIDYVSSRDVLFDGQF